MTGQGGALLTIRNSSSALVRAQDRYKGPPTPALAEAFAPSLALSPVKTRWSEKRKKLLDIKIQATDNRRVQLFCHVHLTHFLHLPNPSMSTFPHDLMRDTRSLTISARHRRACIPWPIRSRRPCQPGTVHDEEMPSVRNPPIDAPERQLLIASN